MTTLVVALGLLGCAGAAQQCAETRVAAHHAWALYVPLAEREAQEADPRLEAEEERAARVQPEAEQAARRRFREQGR